jgi:hypothetical protein
MKLLVDCFNYTTMKPTGLVELYNITADPYEYDNLASKLPAAKLVATLVARLAAHAASTDQVPPTLFPENAPKKAAAGIAPGYYQCPQCGQGNAFCDGSSSSSSSSSVDAYACRLDPWCDGAKCVETKPLPPSPPVKWMD